MIKHYLITSLRNLLKNKTQSIVGIGGLSLSFVIFVAAFYWIYYELSYDTFYKDHKSMYLVNSIIDANTIWVTTPQNLYNKLQQKFPEIEKTAGYHKREYKVKSNDKEKSYNLNTLIVFGEYFEMFPHELVSGALPDPNKKEIILSESFANRLYHTIDVIGKNIEIDLDYPYNASQSFEIVGIAKDTRKTSMPFDVIFPYFPNRNDDWSNHNVYTIIKLKNNIDFDTFSEKLRSTKIEDKSLSLVKINRIKYLGDGKAFIDVYGFLLIVTFISLLLLISALFNYIVLNITNINSSIKESGIRKSFGAGIWDIFKFLYSRTILSFLFVLFLSFLTFIIFGKSLLNFTGVIMDGSDFYIILLVIWIVCLIITFISITYPIYRLYRLNVQASIIKRRNLFRKVVLTLQIATSIFLLFSLMQISRQFLYMNNTDLGFNKENVFELSFPASEGSIIALMNELKSSPDIKQMLPMKFRFFIEGSYSNNNSGLFDEKTEKRTNIIPVPTEFIDFFDIKMIAGKKFDKNVSTNQVVVNKKVLEDFPNVEILGKVIRFREVDAEIVGVIDNIHTNPMNKEIVSNVFACGEEVDVLWGKTREYLYIRYASGKENEIRKAIISACEKIIPGTPVELITFNKYLGTFYESEKRTIQIFGTIGLSCLLICLLGVYAMVNLTTKQRKREIAIRKVNGATNKNIFTKLLKEYLMLVLIACIIVLPFGYKFISYWLQSYAYKVSLGMEVILLIILITGLVVVTVIQKIIEVASTNPAESLKAE